MPHLQIPACDTNNGRHAPMTRALAGLRRAVGLGETVALGDGQLLERFRATRDEAAFEALVRRHGPMVLGVCRRVLGHHHDAEDAFQATFLVLAQRAGSIRPEGRVANWLYGVAYRTALKARALVLRRRGREKQVMDMPEPEAAQPKQWSELELLLDRELNQLPDKYRTPMVLCDLEGKTQREAARQLGWPQGTLAGRLARARALLARRLARHGPVLSGGVLAVTLAQQAIAAVPAPLLTATVQAAAAFTAGSAGAGLVSARVLSLTKGVSRMLLLSKLKVVPALVLAVAGALLVGTGMFQTPAAETPREVVAAAPPVEGPSPELALKPPGSITTSPPVVAKEPPAHGKDKESVKLPLGPAPFQALASLDKDGLVVIKTRLMYYHPVNVINQQGNPVTSYYMVDKLNIVRYALKEVTAQPVGGKILSAKQLAKLLKEETLVLVSPNGQPIDVLHLRLIKDGTLILTFSGPGLNANPPLPAVPAPPVLEPPAGLPPPVVPQTTPPLPPQSVDPQPTPPVQEVPAIPPGPPQLVPPTPSIPSQSLPPVPTVPGN
jgi:RNA polymerase sigma factor (sigma-70 family)